MFLNDTTSLSSSSSPLLAALLTKPSPLSHPIEVIHSHECNNNLSLVDHLPITVPIDKNLMATLNTKKEFQPVVNKCVPRRPLDWKLVKPAEQDIMGESSSTLISNDGRSACLHASCSSCFSTEAVRTDTPIRANCITRFEWHVDAHATSGTSCMFGVCSDATRLYSSHGYVNLLGADETSWALSSKGSLHHAGQCLTNYCAPFDDGREHTVACVVNSLAGRIEFYVDGKSMGRAFEFNPSESRLYACVSSTTCRSIFRLVSAYETYASLQAMCAYRVQSDASGALIARGLHEYHLNKSMLLIS